jgi:hypothetical protein
MLRVCSLATNLGAEAWLSPRTTEELVTPTLCFHQLLAVNTQQRTHLNVMPCSSTGNTLALFLQQNQVLIRITALVLPSTFDRAGSTGRTIICLHYSYSY